MEGFGSAVLAARLPELRTQVRRHIADHRAAAPFTPAVDSWLVSASPAFSESLGERGWLGATWPRRYGGGDRTALERFAIVEELLAAGAPVACHWFAERQIGPCILRHGSERQKQEFLPAIAADRCYFAVGMSEPGTGSDLASVSTKAERVPGGWRVTGTKLWTSGAHRAHYLMALCRMEDRPDRHEGLSQLIVPLHASGVTVNRLSSLDGEAEFAEVVMDDVFVPDGYLVGEAGGGWQQVLSELTFERSGPERYVSLFLQLSLLAREAAKGSPADLRTLGEVLSQLWAVRGLGLRALTGDVPERRRSLDAALVKDVGTVYEQSCVDTVRRQLAGSLSGPKDRALMAASVERSPSITLRGGTTEVLRSMIWRGLTESGSTQGGGA